MIGKIIVGKSFKGCLMYCLHDKLKKHENEEVFKNRAEIISFNKCEGTAQELINQFNRVRQLNSNLSKPVFHITLSFALGEHLSKDKLMEISELCAKDFGFENNQYVSILHTDTKYQHLHIVANRIEFDKKTVSDSNNYQKMATFCRKMELKYNLKQVLSPKRYLSKQQQMLPRNDERKKALAQAIRNGISNSKDIEQFIRIMQSKGYKIIKSRGISFIDKKKVRIKGSEVGYPLQKIEKILEFQHRLKTDREFFKQVIDRKPLKGLTEAANQVLSKKQSISVTSQLAQDISKAMDALLKPEQLSEQNNPDLLVKKKKRRRLHL